MLWRNPMENIEIGDWKIIFMNSSIYLNAPNGGEFIFQHIENTAFGRRKLDGGTSWTTGSLPVKKPIGLSYCDNISTGLKPIKCDGDRQVLGEHSGWTITRYDGVGAGIALTSRIRGDIHILRISSGWLSIYPPQHEHKQKPPPQVDWGIIGVAKALKTILTPTIPLTVLIENGYKYDYDELYDSG